MRRIKELNHVAELIKSEGRIDEIIKSYGVELLASGENWKASCPFHEERTPSFGVSNLRQLYHCFGCKEGGDVFSFVQTIETVPFDEAVRKVADILGFDLTPYEADATPEELRALEHYRKYEAEAHHYTNGIGDERYDEWVQRRRFNILVLDQYYIGFDKNSGRVSIPLKDAYGRVAGIRTKSIDGTGDKIDGPSSKHPVPVPPIYGLYEARREIRKAGFVILVEGEPDVWQMVSAGFGNTASVLGSKLNSEQLEYLKSVGVTRAVLLADTDSAGAKFVSKFAATPNKTGVAVRIAIPKVNSGKDPDEIILAHGTDPIQSAIDSAVHQFEYVIQDAWARHDPQNGSQKLDFLNEMQEKIINFPELERELAVSQIAGLVGMPRDVLDDYFKEGEDANVATLHNTRGERVVLTRMVHDNEFCGQALISLHIEDFYLTKHRSAFQTIGQLFRSNQPVNAETVELTLSKNGSTLQGILVDNTDNAEFHLSDLRDKALRRSVQKRATEIAARMRDTSIDAGVSIQKFASEIASSIVGGGDKLKTASELVKSTISIMHERMKEPNAIIGLDLGPDWFVFNHTIHGLQRGRYAVIAAPSGVGKTAMAGSWAGRVSVELNEPATYFTFETGPEAMLHRMVARASGVESDKIITGMVNEEEAELVHDAAANISGSPLVFTSRGRTFTETQAIIRHDVLRRGTRVIFVDYLQLMSHGGQEARGVSRYEEVGLISRGLLELAQELNISIVALAQINREGTKRGDANKEDVGDSYKIVQDADIFYVMREMSKDEIAATGSKGSRVGLLDKHRHGKAGIKTNLAADLNVMRIYEVK